MSRFIPYNGNAEKVFEAAARFKQRCLIEEKSLFLVDTHLWTSEHFRVLITNFVQQPEIGSGGFYSRLESQLAVCEPLDVALMAEVFWIFQLGPTNLGGGTKLRSIERIWDIKPAASFPKNSEFLDPSVLTGLGSAGAGYNKYVAREMAFAIEAFANLLAVARDEREALLGEPFEFARWLDKIPSGTGRQFYHTLCHLLFPDDFERIFSGGHKCQVARAHGIWMRSMDDDRPGLDYALRDLRKRLEAQHAQPIDYYEPPVGTLIKEQSKGEGFATLPTDVESDGAKIEDLPTDRDIASADNVIYFGPPGTGKTYAMQERMRKAFAAGDDFEFVAFHPSYSYEEFVGGLRPVPKEGATTLAFHKGPFVRLCERAHADPTRRFTLFIDEINRANVAKVFGELITLLETSKRVPAGSKPDGEALWITLPGMEASFGVPDNLGVVATMNSADRSIATLDIALRRRFRFEEFLPRPEDIEPPRVEAIDLRRLLRTINDRLEFLLDRDHVIGHAYFLGIQSISELREVFSQRIIPLLQEYFFDDLRKVQLVLCGHDRDSVFVHSRNLTPTSLFPGARNTVGAESRRVFSAGDPGQWTEARFIEMYGSEFSGEIASQELESTEVDNALAADVS